MEISEKHAAALQTISEWSRTGKNYIAGQWGVSRNDIDVIDPSTMRAFAGVPESHRNELDHAVDAANDAFVEWSRWSWVRRAEVVDDMAQLAKGEREQIALLMALECGKHINECRADVTEGIHMLQYSAGMGRQPIGYKLSSEIAEKEIETYRMPKGVCAVITPWNFPFAIPTWLISPALVCGNTVVFKPSEETPLCGQFLAHLFHEAGLKHGVPPGVLNLVHGKGETAGDYLVRHPYTHGQLFTGSYGVGSGIKKIAAEHYDKFAICEMGGKNSLIVMDDANLDLAVKAAVLSAYKTTHQRCVSADLLIVHKKIAGTFIKQFLDMTKRVRFGDPLDETIFAGPLINQQAVEKYNSFAAQARKECDQPLFLGYARNKSNFVSPNIFRMQYRHNTFVLREEAFTPNIIIVPVDDFDEALGVANDHEYGLAMSLITQDFRKMREFKMRGKAGLKYINLPTIGAEVHLPFGGMRRSGTGMPSAAWLFNYLCHETAFTVNYSDTIQMAQGLSADV